MKNKPSKLIISGYKKTNQIALTYDCGIEKSEILIKNISQKHVVQTLNLLDVLKKHKIRATFFITGIWAETFPELVKHIASDGHEIGNHSYAHKDMTKISCEEIKKSIIKTEKIILNIAGLNTRPLFREPYGAWNRKVLKAVGDAGYGYSIYWSIDPIDWQEPHTKVIVQRILKKLGIGDIVLMHIWGENTAAATDIVVSKLKHLCFEFVTVSELLK